MSKRTFASMFSGGGLADVGMIAAGWEPLWGIEHSEDIAGVYRANIDSCVMVADVRSVEYRGLPKPDHLHASPVCKNASVANSDGKETAWDLECADAVCRALRALEPETFTLENVYPYRRFKSYLRICACLTEMGYWWEHHHINAADMSVPQTRKRLILRATQGGYLRPLPSAAPWRGWYAAIEDLIDTLPPSRFADWQLMRLPSDLTDTFLHMTSNTQKANPTGTGEYARSSPANTVTSGDGARPRAFLCSDQSANNGVECGLRDAAEPSASVRALQSGGTVPKAFLIDGKPLNYGGDLQIKAGSAPSPTLTSTQGQHPFRAFLMSTNGENSDYRVGAEPAPTVTTGHSAEKSRAFIVEGSAAGADNPFPLQAIPAEQPVFTMRARQNNPRAWLEQGRVVAMTPRALLRFQSGPDWYELPTNKKLACVVIGNGVPPLMMQRIAESLTP